MDFAIEAGCIAGTNKLKRWGFADWANVGHGYLLDARSVSFGQHEEPSYQQIAA
jgi:hypothetical protein